MRLGPSCVRLRVCVGCKGRAWGGGGVQGPCCLRVCACVHPYVCVRVARMSLCARACPRTHTGAGRPGAARWRRTHTQARTHLRTRLPTRPHPLRHRCRRGGGRWRRIRARRRARREEAARRLGRRMARPSPPPPAPRALPSRARLFAAAKSDDRNTSCSRSEM